MSFEFLCQISLEKWRLSGCLFLQWSKFYCYICKQTRLAWMFLSVWFSSPSRAADFLTEYCLQNASDSRDAISVTCDGPGPRPSSVCVPSGHPVTVSPLTHHSVVTHAGVTPHSGFSRFPWFRNLCHSLPDNLDPGTLLLLTRARCPDTNQNFNMQSYFMRDVGSKPIGHQTRNDKN